jgi:hypothetical protein
MLSAAARARDAAVWTTLSAKEGLCDELDSLLRSGPDASRAGAESVVAERWTALPELPAAWEKKLGARRDAALHALAEPGAAGAYVARIEKGVAARREALLEIEIMLGLDSPAEFRAQRLALQVRQLRERFRSWATANAEAATERVLGWCAEPGVTDASDRQRFERVLSAIGQAR